MQIPFLSRVLRFGLTGCVGLVIDFSITYFLKEKVLINKFVANACGFTCAVTSNFFLSKYWTFSVAGNRSMTSQFFLFTIISIMGLCINSSIILLLIKKINMRFYLSK